MDITGTIIAVLSAQSGVSQRTGNSWMRQDYVLEVPGMYPKRMVFNIFGEDRIKQFALRQGEQNVTVQFEIDAHEHEGRWYNEIRAYNVSPCRGSRPTTVTADNTTAQRWTTCLRTFSAATASPAGQRRPAVLTTKKTS